MESPDIVQNFRNASPSQAAKALGFCGIGSSGVPEGAVSENGRLRQAAGGHPGGDRRRSVLMLPTLQCTGARSSDEYCNKVQRYINQDYIGRRELPVDSLETIAAKPQHSASKRR